MPSSASNPGRHSNFAARQHTPLKKIRPDSVGFDFDGVIADIGEAFIRLACERYDYCSISLEEISSFQVEHCTDIPRKVVESIFDDILQDSLGVGLKPMAGAVETLVRLSRVADVTIITARPVIGPVQDWFDFYCSTRNGGHIRLVATGDHDNKETFIRQCGLQHFIDDRTLTCLQLAEAGLSPSFIPSRGIAISTTCRQSPTGMKSPICLIFRRPRDRSNDHNPAFSHCPTLKLRP